MTDETTVDPYPHKIQIRRDDGRMNIDWLEYETGYEQLHPRRDIVGKMADMGYEYGRDWICSRSIDNNAVEDPISGYVNVKARYTLEFRDEQTATLFLLIS
jgi:hypothetical protein